MPTTENERALELMKDVAKEVAKDVYADAAKPTVKATGELVGLVPRAIKAAFEPLEKWVLQREYNIAETKKILEEKLRDTQPELIEAPEPYIAVPALQAISYCENNDELRDMYANLLAKSMNSVVKDGIHPAFVETIRQLCPDEAKILRYLATSNSIPTISFCVDSKYATTKVIIREFSNVPKLVGCENPFDCEEYFDNLVRLGLLDRTNDSLANEERYAELLDDEDVKKIRLNFEKALERKNEGDSLRIGKHFVELTPFGKRFCNICICSKACIESYDNSVKIAFFG